jgi:hypothetical protein
MIAIRKSRSSSGRPYKPTAEAIRRECERIQAKWSPRERDKRAGRLRTSQWSPPNIPLPLILEAVEEDRGSRHVHFGQFANAT